MLNLKHILQKYIIGHSNTISKITQPIKNHLGINFFGYHRIDNDGKYLTLTDHPEWAEYYLDNELFHNDPFLKHPSEYSKGISFFGDVGKKSFKDTLSCAWEKITKSNDGIVLIEKNNNDVKFFIFAADHQDKDFKKLYLNHFSLLQEYVERS